MPTDEEAAWAPFDRLRDALQEVLTPLGLNVHDWVVMPRDHAMNVVLAVDLTAFLPDEERETLRQFNEMMSDQQRHEMQQRASKKVQNMLDQMTGVLGDVPPEA